MLGFTPFKKHANKFNYIPRYYDPEKEAREQRRAELRGERAEDAGGEYRPGQYIRTQRDARAARRSKEEKTGRMEDLLWKDSRKNKVFVVKRQRAGVRPAALRYQVVRAGEESLVRVFLETGRSHQIRVQFASRGFPLVGDHKYGSRAKETEIRLFSAGLEFPWNGKRLRFEAQPEWV